MARRMAPMILHPNTPEPAGGWDAFWAAALGPCPEQDAEPEPTGSLAAIHAQYDHPVAVYRQDGVITVVPDDGVPF